MIDLRCSVHACFYPASRHAWSLFCDMHWAVLPGSLRVEVTEAIQDMYDSGGTDPGQPALNALLARVRQRAYDLTDRPLDEVAR